MSADIIAFPGATSLDISPELVLSEASKQEFERVIVIGLTKDGDEYVSCSDADGGVFLWDVERAKHRMMRAVDALEE